MRASEASPYASKASESDDDAEGGGGALPRVRQICDAVFDSGTNEAERRAPLEVASGCSDIEPGFSEKRPAGQTGALQSGVSAPAHGKPGNARIAYLLRNHIIQDT